MEDVKTVQIRISNLFWVEILIYRPDINKNKNRIRNTDCKLEKIYTYAGSRASRF